MQRHQRPPRRLLVGLLLALAWALACDAYIRDEEILGACSSMYVCMFERVPPGGGRGLD